MIYMPCTSTRARRKPSDTVFNQSSHFYYSHQAPRMPAVLLQHSRMCMSFHQPTRPRSPLALTFDTRAPTTPTQRITSSAQYQSMQHAVLHPHSLTRPQTTA